MGIAESQVPTSYGPADRLCNCKNPNGCFICVLGAPVIRVSFISSSGKSRYYKFHTGKVDIFH